MIRWIFAGLFLVTLAWAQPNTISPEKSKKSNEILVKARQVDLLNQLLPLVLTTDQINKLLPVLEKVRSKENEVAAKEAEQMRVMEPKIDSALQKGVKDGVVPTKELLRELNNMFIAFTMIREAITDENVNTILTGLKATLNAGQLKAAQNSMDPKAFDPAAKPSEMTSDDKLKVFIKNVLMDWICYDLLVKLAQKK